ncbi:MAG TPA: hypothetical protein VNO51_13250 [Ilumatobacteraceae bacterium]|nr:hypothetical protein [Ilumatobacteraceae bacterium]
MTAIVILAGVAAGGSGPDIAEAATPEPGKGYVAVTPVRVLDTRRDANPLLHNEARTLQVAGLVPVPETAVAVAMNVTVTQPSGDGFLTVWPGGSAQPATSSVNFGAGESVPNLVTVGVGADGEILIHDFLYSETGTTHVIVDVVGYYQAGFNPIVPSRIVDTRVGLGGIRLGPGEVRTVQIEGAGSLPATTISAVALNVTAVSPTGEGGFLTIWPTGQPMPVASSLNFVPGDIIANAVISGVGDDGTISIFNFSGDTDVLVDVTGWFSSGFTGVTPYRALDTRNPGVFAFAPGQSRNLRVAGVGGVPATGVGAVAMNVTATQPTETGFLTIWRSGRLMPEASSLNFVAGQTVPNAVISDVSAEGEVTIHNPFGNTHVLVDITGWFSLSNSAPELVSLSLSPRDVDTTAAARQITVEARIIDDVSGNKTTRIRFESPSSAEFVEAVFETPQRTSGTAADGVYEFVMTLPMASEPGLWTVSFVTLVDNTDTSRSLTAPDLQAAGLPTTFTVT